MKRNKKFNSSLVVFLIFIATIIFSVAIYISSNFPDQSIDEMLFYLFNGMDGTSSDVFISAIKTSIIPFLLLFFLLLFPLFSRFTKRENTIEVTFRRKTFNFNVFPIKSSFSRMVYALLVLLSSLSVCFSLLGVGDYIKRLFDYSTLIENHYVNPQDVSIKFPDEKRNLIILYLESVENSIIKRENGGGWDYTIIPELERIAMDNINFSDSDKIGGALPVSGTAWTVGGLVGTTSGLPLKIPIDDGNAYTSSDNFLAGAYTLGDMLEKEGYNLKLMVGSEAEFGGRSNYYIKHGNYEIFDLNTAIEEGKMLESEKVWWGFDDTHLFKWAKEEITELASKEEPFSFSFLTVNTHFQDGYLEDGAENTFDTQYENVYAYSSKQVDEFVHWLQKQEFYNNTTLVIMGDHLSMQDPKFFYQHIYEGYKRTIYNAFINPAIGPSKSKNRIFTPLDMYPTMLASIGVEIEGDRLALGTNLFSTKETLTEELGIGYVKEELAKNSNFYNHNILQDDYFNLLEQANQ